jgi:HPt (histidine-containing phosphotransfer) domain-containing protein
MRPRMITIGLATLLVVGACSGSSTPTPDPQVAFCSSISSLASALKTLKSMDATDTISDIQTSAESVQTAFQAFKDAAGNLASSEVDAIETAATNLQDAVAAIPSSDTVDQAIVSLKPQIEALEQARREAGKAQCGEVKLSATPAPSTAAEAPATPAAS